MIQEFQIVNKNNNIMTSLKLLTFNILSFIFTIPYIASACLKSLNFLFLQATMKNFCKIRRKAI